jgi:hypothetical protein
MTGKSMQTTKNPTKMPMACVYRSGIFQYFLGIASPSEPRICLTRLLLATDLPAIFLRMRRKKPIQYNKD